MVRKGIAILLFLLVSAGFLYGFITYNRRLSNMMNQEIKQAEASEEPDIPAETPGSKNEDREPDEKPDDTDKLITIPGIVGLSEADAVKALEEVGLVAEIHQEYIDDVDKGTVFYQRPPKNNEVPEGTVISFSVSRGPYGSSEDKASVKVPDLIGKTEAQAKALLDTLKLKMKSVNVYSETVKNGLIISQDVAAGKEADEESTITVKVSRGRELIDVPDVLNRSEAEAKASLEAIGLKVFLKREYSDKALGLVISQSPGAGRAAKGSTISLTVSSGQEPISPVPDPVEPEPEDTEDPDAEEEPIPPVNEPEETPIG